MENKNLMDEMIAAADALKCSKLKGLTEVLPVLERIRERMLLSTQKEVMVLVAIFDRQCSDDASSLDDLTGYFQCSSMETMALSPTIKGLLTKGYLKTEETMERKATKVKYKILPEVFSAMVEGGDIRPLRPDADMKLDQFAFCAQVQKALDERRLCEISTRELFAAVERLESEHTDLEMVRGLKEMVADIDARVWYYEMCFNYTRDFNEESTAIKEALKYIYDNVAEGARVRMAIHEDNHPLILSGLMCNKGSGDIMKRRKEEMILTDKGKRLLFGSAAPAYARSYDCVDRYDFIDMIEGMMDEMPRGASRREYGNLYNDVRKLEEQNTHLSFIGEVKKLLQLTSDRILFYCVCRDMLTSCDFRLRSLGGIFYRSEEIKVKRALMMKQHPLQKFELAELKSGTFLEGTVLHMTDKGKELFLEEDMELFVENVNGEGLIECGKIAEKRLFFEPALERQLGMLRECLMERNLAPMRDRLKENSLPSGIAVLLYGLPGTGKTESVMQIARATGRSVMHVDISNTKSCWFGESEKIIKEIFNKYRKLCQKSNVKPILLFNEADAVFSKRKDATSSTVAQTENAIQNIILEEMESLDGILIATTNMACNLDRAFERRFLFKIRFDKPSVESKKHIWMDKMTRLTESEATQLATAFDFSGGEIDNIVRKALMEEVVDGKVPDMERMITLCSEERVSANNRKVGF